MRAMRWLLPLVFLTGCIALQPVREEPVYRPTFPVGQATPPAPGGAIYHEGYGVELFSDRRAMRVGDVVTVVLEERTSSSKSAETSYKKQADATLPEPTVLGSLIKGAAENNGLINSIDSKSGFSGEADSDQSNSLSGTITAVVAAVYPNGLMLIQGEKWLNLNRGDEYVRVSGLVRPEDIDGSNMVSSLRLADARIAYSGTGAFADTNKAGWISRFFLSPWMPF